MTGSLTPTELRAGHDGDGPGIIDLISRCWAEYPGVRMDVDGENPELRALATHFREAGGALWVAETAKGLQGMVGARPREGENWELCRMYVDSAARGSGLANMLVQAAEDHARAQGARRMHLWSDTRFDRAHRFYERHGYVRDGGIKPLMDISNTIDFGYAKPLSGVAVWRLDVAAAASAERGLGRILAACVEAGASVSFLQPYSVAEGEAFYRGKTASIAAGRRILLAAWLDGALAGTVMVDLDLPPNQTHRAEIQKLLVHPAARRLGVAQALMAAAESEAAAAGRTLLTLDTCTGHGAEILYREAGWTEVGVIPGFAREADGTLGATTFFYKTLSA